MVWKRKISIRECKLNRDSKISKEHQFAQEKQSASSFPHVQAGVFHMQSPSLWWFQGAATYGPRLDHVMTACILFWDRHCFHRNMVKTTPPMGWDGNRSWLLHSISNLCPCQGRTTLFTIHMLFSPFLCVQNFMYALHVWSIWRIYFWSLISQMVEFYSLRYTTIHTLSLVRLRLKLNNQLLALSTVGGRR